MSSPPNINALMRVMLVLGPRLRVRLHRRHLRDLACHYQGFRRPFLLGPVELPLLAGGQSLVTSKLCFIVGTTDRAGLSSRSNHHLVDAVFIFILLFIFALIFSPVNGSYMSMLRGSLGAYSLNQRCWMFEREWPGTHGVNATMNDFDSSYMAMQCICSILVFSSRLRAERTTRGLSTLSCNSEIVQIRVRSSNQNLLHVQKCL